MPQTFDRNGIGVSFAIDTRSYRIEAEEMAILIRQGNVNEWVKYNASFHVKLYSLSFALAGAVVGHNILAAEPLNLLYYLLILALTFGIAWEVFDERVALLAGSAVALWPSLLLHTIQLLRDALFIPSMLLLSMALLLAINKNLSFKRGSVVGLVGGLGALMVWLCRGDSWEIVIGILIISGTIWVLSQIKQGTLSKGSAVAMIVISVFIACTPKLIPTYRQSNSVLMASAHGRDQGTSSTQHETELRVSRWDVARRVALLRHNFIVRYPLAGSNVDSGIELQDTMDLIRYLPRAALIGLCAPFPNMWVAKGEQVGWAGRLIAGAEMLLMYVIMIFAALGLLKERRRLAVWLLFGIAFAGCSALGLVVVNISTLYRMRYAYFILIIILGMGGVLSALPASVKSKFQIARV